MTARLLIVSHSRTGGTRAMAEAVRAGTAAEGISGVDVVERPALEATGADVLAADGILLGTPANLGYMSGALKHFFDETYYDLLDRTDGLPYGLFVKGSTDTDGAVLAVQRIVTGLRWRAVADPVTVAGDADQTVLDRCWELGATMAAGLAEGLFGR